MTRGPFVALTRHYAGLLLAPPLLTELGADYLRRTIASLIAMVLVTGIFVTRVFFRKYTDLGGLTYPDAYLRALQSDTLFMIAVPMLIVGLAAVVLGPLLFPDETDYYVLTPLPITRTVVFGARLAAVAIAGGVIVIAVCAISSFWFPLATGGRRAPHPALVRIAAHAVSTVAGSAWMFSAVVAIQGLGVVMMPAGWRRLGLAVQGGMSAVLLICVPFLARLPSTVVSADTIVAMPLAAFPPSWFLGVEHWMQDPSRVDGYAAIARYVWPAFAVTIGAIGVSYAILYRTAERLVGLARTDASRRQPSPLRIVERRLGLRPATAGVIDFAIAGLARSRLHQFVFVLIASCGAAALLGQIASAWTGDLSSVWRARAAAHAALAAPLLAALTVALALRAAFLLPVDRAAAWVFRVTEEPHARTAALDGVTWCFRTAVLIATVVATALVQPEMPGSRWLLAMPLTVLLSLGLIEAVLMDWNRIPFTCSYLPGKRVLAYNLGVLLGAYFVFVYLGGHALRWSVASGLRAMGTAGMLAALVAVMRRARLQTWGVAPLDFEDYDRMTVRTLGLLPDEH
jgi:hypothetical protein